MGMNNSIIRVLIFIMVLSLNGCSDEGELTPDSPIVGTWNLDLLAYNDFPDGFESNNGTIVLVEELGMEELKYSFNLDATFHSISRINGSDYTWSGEFNYTKQSLIIKTIDQTELVGPELGSLIDNNRLAMNRRVEVMALPNQVLDTLTQDLREEDFTKHSSLVKVNLYYFLNKVN